MDERIAGLGTILVDDIMIVEETPRIDEKRDAVDDARQVGGPVPTALALLARLGLRSRFLGCWGNDADGTCIESVLQEDGISFPASSRRSDGRTGHAHVWVEAHTGRRTVVCRRPSGGAANGPLDAGELANVGWLHLDGWPPDRAVDAARIVHGRGGRVSIDAGSPRPRMDEIIAVADLVNCPRRFLERYLDESDPLVGAHRLLSMGAQQVTVTDGAEGAWLVDRSGAWHCPALPLDRITDTNGAGDVFCGGLLYGCLAGWEPQERLRFACAAAGLKCRERGNRAALPELEDVTSAMGRLTAEHLTAR
ncbi:MAG: carbohydrate kinase family protein [Maioricimonas sp. JB049]